MKFFVILAVLVLRGMPGQKLTRPFDRAFLGWQRWIAARLGCRLGAAPGFLAAVLPWVLILWLLLWWLHASFWVLPTLAVHLLVVFYALGRRSELVWVERYMVAWRQGDHQAASYYAEEILDDNDLGDDACQLHARVVARLIYFAFDRLFLVLFWYLLLGPVGALLARLSERTISNARKEEQAQEDLACDEQVSLFHRVLEWPAARLMGLSLALVSRPLLGLRQFASDLLRWKLTSEDFLNRQLLTGYGILSRDQEARDVFAQRPEIMTEEADQELAQMKERVWRVLALWVAVTAVGVIFWS
ncbi:regulatory signaling modulator protein AmpE [Marinospirillum sp.]|uniref:regulatory signaling modulator protein AmpE n=1 Tax=Marinospirillum sp. TaxID=2183934 RepID=UPI00384F6B68